MKLQDKVALITGGSAGIGEAIAIRFASEGAKVAVVASTDIVKAEKVVDTISAAGGIAQAFVANVAEVAEIEALVEAVAIAFGGIHILVNSAGIVGGTPAGATSESDYDRIMDTNLKGTFFCANAVVPLMKAQGSGHIVNISGIGAFKGSSGSAAYSASKAAGHQLGKIAAIELASHGIRVNMINADAVFAHADIPSGLWLEVGPERARSRGMNTSELPEYYRNRNLLKARVSGHHVGNAVVFFASNATPTTGATLPVDGGVAEAFPR